MPDAPPCLLCKPPAEQPHCRRRIERHRNYDGSNGNDAAQTGVVGERIGAVLGIHVGGKRVAVREAAGKAVEADEQVAGNTVVPACVEIECEAGGDIEIVCGDFSAVEVEG